MYSEADAQNWGENPYPYIPSELDIISNPNFLYNSFLKSKKGVSWKSSVQRYEINLLSEIAKTKEELQLLLQDLKVKYSQLGIFVNEKKTRILALTHEVTYLKIRYILKESGKVIQLIPNETFDRYIRKLKKFHNKYLNNQMSLDDIIQSFKSWFGSYYKYDSKQRLYELVYYFKILFNIPTDYLLSPEYNF